MNVALSGCWEKVDRAKHHLDSLDAEFRPGPKNDLYKALTYSDPHGNLIFEARIAARVLVRWGVIAGEVAHDLRSALDHAMCALVRRTIPDSDCAYLYFPIYTKRLANGERRNELVSIADPKAEAIIEGVQPCHALDGPEMHPLWLLHLLNRWDKHRMVQVAALRLGFPVDAAPPDQAAKIIQLNVARTTLKDHTTVYSYKVNMPPAVEMKRQPILVIGFDGPGPVAGEPMLPLLGGMGRAVEDILTKLEPLFP